MCVEYIEVIGSELVGVDEKGRPKQNQKTFLFKKKYKATELIGVIVCKWQPLIVCNYYGLTLLNRFLAQILA